MTVRILTGCALSVLPTLPAGSAQTCVTSPPYYGLRDYGVAGQIGLESSPDEYVARLVAVMREVRRVLRDDGTLWLNLGDSYAGSGKGGNPEAGKEATNKGSQSVGVLYGKVGDTARMAAVTNVTRKTHEIGAKPKDLLGIPWRVAFALQADGWWLRSDVIWSKPNAMPESVTDRPTKAHEYLFLLSKAERYFYDAEAIAEPCASGAGERQPSPRKAQQAVGRIVDQRTAAAGFARGIAWGETRTARSVWTIATQPYAGAHFATMPPELARRCILAGSRPGDTVLDPFGGAGTTGLVADRLGRDAVLIELNPTYAALGRERITSDAPLFADTDVTEVA